MSNIETSMERIAKNVGCGTTALRGRMELILSEQKSTWTEAGKDDEQCTLLALRVAGRQIKSENDKVKRSGCTNFEGMFLTSPRYKDWAEMSYKKMANTLSSGDENIRNALVEQGKIVVFEYDPETDGFTKHSNPSLDRKDDFVAGRHETNVSVLPKEAVEIDSNTHYYLVWNAPLHRCSQVAIRTSSMVLHALRARKSALVYSLVAHPQVETGALGLSALVAPLLKTHGLLTHPEISVCVLLEMALLHTVNSRFRHLSLMNH